MTLPPHLGARWFFLRPARAGFGSVLEMEASHTLDQVQDFHDLLDLEDEARRREDQFRGK